MTKVTIKTLRYYDEIGLLKPSFVDRENGYRYYGTDQLMELHKIIALRQIDLSINEIKSILNGECFESILLKRKAEIESKIADSKITLSKINHILQTKGEMFLMEYQAVIKELPECIVYTKRTVIPNYNEYFTLIPSIGEKIKKANPNLKCRVPEYCFVVYHDGEYKEKDIDIEFCEAVTEFGNEVDDIKFKKIEKVKAATTLHKGSYSDLGKAYAFLIEWISKNGYKIIDNPRESYIDGIWNKENESQWLTEIQFPIK